MYICKIHSIIIWLVFFLLLIYCYVHKASNFPSLVRGLQNIVNCTNKASWMIILSTDLICVRDVLRFQCAQNSPMTSLFYGDFQSIALQTILMQELPILHFDKGYVLYA